MIEEELPAKTNKKELTYIQKVWQTVAVGALLIVSILIARVAFNVILMILAGSLIATYFHGLGDVIERRTRFSRRWAMIASITLTFVLLVLLFWFMGNKIQHQSIELSRTLPNTINNAKAKLAESSIGQQILGSFSGDNSQKLMATAQQFFSTGFGVAADVYVIFLLGVFFTAHPSLYKDGILLLFPQHKKPQARHVMDRISQSLKGWLKGTMLSIVLIFILITIGLTIMRIPAALVLGLIAGVFKIVPNFGSFFAMIPGVLLALTVSVNTAIIVLIIYTVSQTIVSSIVTPIIQNKIINIPPALTIISQVIMGTLTGALGIILAVPLVAILIILVDEMYVKKINQTAIVTEVSN